MDLKQTVSSAYIMTLQQGAYTVVCVYYNHGQKYLVRCDYSFTTSGPYIIEINDTSRPEYLVVKYQ